MQELGPSSPVVVEAAAEDQIDFGEVDEATSVGTSQSNGDFVHVEHEEIDFGDVDDNISWNISVQDDGSGNVDSIGACTVDSIQGVWNIHYWPGIRQGSVQFVTVSSTAGSEEGGANVAKGTDALSVLHNATTREMFLNELRELECFLQQRIVEVSFEGESSFGTSYELVRWSLSASRVNTTSLLAGDVLLVSIMQGAPETLQKQTMESLREMSREIKQLLETLTTQKMLHLYQISSSPRYVDRLVSVALYLWKRLCTCWSKISQSREVVKSDYQIFASPPQVEQLEHRLHLAEKYTRSREAVIAHREEAFEEQKR